MLDVEGEDPESQRPALEQFRANNVELLKKQQELEKQLEDLKGKASQVAPKEEENKTLSQQVAHLTKLFEESQKKTQEAEKTAREEQWRGSFLQSATKHKVRDDSAAKVLHSLASLTFREKDGQRVPLDNDGNTIYSKKSTSLTPITLDDWMEEQKGGAYKDLFSLPTGGGARGSGGSAPTPGKIQITKEQSRFPNADQLKAMSEGKADIVDNA